MEQDYKEAAAWYRKAGEQGHAKAQYGLGGLYLLGFGVTEDYDRAAEWYRKAAEQGHANAQYDLGDLYSLGKGVVQDHAAAAEWYRKAASRVSRDPWFGVWSFQQGVPSPCHVIERDD